MDKPRMNGLNPEFDGVSRTIKAQYYKTGCINYIYHNDWGATGVMAIYETK